MPTSSPKAQSHEKNTDGHREPAQEERPPWLPRNRALEDALIHCLAKMARFLLHRERTFREENGGDDAPPGRGRPASPS